MLTKSFVISCSIGLHARPASMLASVATGFKSNITIKYKGKEVPGDSVIGILTLGAENGDSLEITISGGDEEQAMKKFEDFFEHELKEL